MEENASEIGRPDLGRCPTSIQRLLRAAERDQMAQQTDAAAAEPMLQFFAYADREPAVQALGFAFSEIAARIVETVPRSPERTVCLRKLLEAKDCAFRAQLFKL